MHEMALAEGILAAVLDLAEGQPVRRVRLRVGALQHVTTDSLQFAFQLAAEDTAAADAVLELQPVPARLRCRRCGAAHAVAGPPFLCVACGASDVSVAGGDELLIDAVELATGWLHRPDSLTAPPEDRAPAGGPRVVLARGDGQAREGIDGS
ncbi:MAG: hydrogenase maturation nickel metallochaperone HypA [Chloroflexi bacterium]|nr:hydrogenase maturation nickel metallochaperone HypA [Chloroflexota bacterium]